MDCYVFFVFCLKMAKDGGMPLNDCHIIDLPPMMDLYSNVIFMNRQQAAQAARHSFIS